MDGIAKLFNVRWKRTGSYVSIQIANQRMDKLTTSRGEYLYKSKDFFIAIVNTPMINPNGLYARGSNKRYDNNWVGRRFTSVDEAKRWLKRLEIAVKAINSTVSVVRYGKYE